MYRIAVCDDEKEAVVYIAGRVEKEFAALGRPADAEWYTAPQVLEQKLQEGVHYDALLLDIDMPGLDGIELCRRFRTYDRDAIIVFVSNREELVFQTFEVSPFRFVRKNYFNDEVQSLCRDIDAELNRRQSSFLRFENRKEGTVYSVNIRRLMYIEAQRKVCVLHSSDEQGQSHQDEIRITFTELEEKLRDFQFVRTHRSYLVNPEYIYQIQKDAVVLTNGEDIPLSRNREEDVRSAFFAWCRTRK